MSAPGSRVIKAGSPAAQPSVQAPEELLAAAVSRAGEIVRAAEGEAAELRRGAIEAVAAARHEASAAGYAEGMGRAAASLALAAEVGEERRGAMEREVVGIALEVARRLVGRELATAPEAVVDMAKRALRPAAGGGEVLLRVAPDDLPIVTAAGGLLRALVDRGSLAFAEDRTLQRGEVIVEAAAGRVDARIAAQLEPFRKALETEER